MRTCCDNLNRATILLLRSSVRDYSDMFVAILYIYYTCIYPSSFISLCTIIILLYMRIQQPSTASTIIIGTRKYIGQYTLTYGLKWWVIAPPSVFKITRILQALLPFTAVSGQSFCMCFIHFIAIGLR